MRRERRGDCKELQKVVHCLQLEGLPHEWVECLLEKCETEIWVDPALSTGVTTDPSQRASGIYDRDTKRLYYPESFFDTTTGKLKRCDKLEESSRATLIQEVFHAWAHQCWPFEENISRSVEEAFSSFLQDLLTHYFLGHARGDYTREQWEAKLDEKDDLWTGIDGEPAISIQPWADRLILKLGLNAVAATLCSTRLLEGWIWFPEGGAKIKDGQPKIVKLGGSGNPHVEWDGTHIIINCKAAEKVIKGSSLHVPAQPPLTEQEARSRLGNLVYPSPPFEFRRAHWVKQYERTRAYVNGCYVIVYSQAFFFLRVEYEHNVPQGNLPPLVAEYSHQNDQVRRIITKRTLCVCCPPG